MLWPLAVLLSEVLLFYRHILFSRNYAIPWDFRYYHMPIMHVMAKGIGNGELPLWDPYTYCGFPVYANICAQLFYPPTMLVFLLNRLTGGKHLLYLFEIQVIAHVFLGGVFAYWLLRRLGTGRAAAVAGATVYQLGAYFSTQTQHLGAMDAAAWLPLAWLCTIALSRKFEWRWLAGLSVALAMCVLSGFPAVTAAVFVSCFLLAGVLLLLRQASFRLPFYLAAGCLWAALISAIQLVPTMELTRRSVASFRSDWSATGGGVIVNALITMVIPNYFHVFQFNGVTWSLPWNVTFLYLYCGIGGLLLALTALVFVRSRRVAVFALMTALSALWMLGDKTPVGRTIFLSLPKFIQNPLYAEFSMPLFVLGVAVLAGFGAHFVIGNRGRAFQAGLIAVVALDLILTSSSRPFNCMSLDHEAGIAYEHFDGVREIPERVRALVNASLPPYRVDTINGSLNWTGAAPLFEVPSASGNDPFALIRLMQFRLLFGKGERPARFTEPVRLDTALFDYLNVRYIISSTPTITGVPGSERLSLIDAVTGQHIFENKRAFPRFFLVGRIEKADGMEAALNRLRSPAFDPRATAVVEGPVDFAPAAGQIERPVKVLRYGLRDFEVETDAARPAFLVTSETYYPGWRAWVDGAEKRPVLTNAAFRGLAVPAGRHRVRMRFEPSSLWYSAWVTLAACLAVAAVFAVGDNKRIRGKWTS